MTETIAEASYRLSSPWGANPYYNVVPTRQPWGNPPFLVRKQGRAGKTHISVHGKNVEGKRVPIKEEEMKLALEMGFVISTHALEETKGKRKEAAIDKLFSQSKPWEHNPYYNIVEESKFLIRQEGPLENIYIAVYGKARGSEVVALSDKEACEAQDQGFIVVKTTLVTVEDDKDWEEVPSSAHDGKSAELASLAKFVSAPACTATPTAAIVTSTKTEEAKNQPTAPTSASTVEAKTPSKPVVSATPMPSPMPSAPKSTETSTKPKVEEKYTKPFPHIYCNDPTHMEVHSLASQYTLALFQRECEIKQLQARLQVVEDALLEKDTQLQQCMALIPREHFEILPYKKPRIIRSWYEEEDMHINNQYIEKEELEYYSPYKVGKKWGRLTGVDVTYHYR